MDRIKKISWLLLILSVLTGILSYSSQFIHFNDKKALLVKRINDSTGLNGEIRGDIGLQLFPLSISMNDFHLYDSDKTIVLSSKKMNLNINPFRIFSGINDAIDVKNIWIVDGDINIKKLKSYVKNKGLKGLDIKSIVLEKCRLISDEPKDDTSSYMFDDINAKIIYSSSIGMDDFNITSNFLIKGTRFNFDSLFKDINIDGSTNEASFSLYNDTVAMKFTGVLKNLFSIPELKGKVSSEVSNPENFNYLIENNLVLKNFFQHNKMNLSADLSIDSNNIFLDNIAITSRDIHNLVGNIEVDMNSGMDIISEMSVDKIDLDGIIPVGLIPQNNMQKYIEDFFVEIIKNFNFDVSPDLSAIFSLNIKEIKLNEQSMTDLKFSADIFDNKMLINELSVQLPYSGKIEMDGVVTRNKVRADLNSEVFVYIPDVKNFSKWLSIDDKNFSNMNTIASKFHLELIPHHISMTNVRTSLGATQFVGKILAYDDTNGKLNFDVSMRFNKLDMDELKVSDAYDNIFFNLFKSDFDKTGSKFSEFTKDLRWLRTWRNPSKIELIVDQLIFRQQPISNAYISMDLLANNLSITQLSFDDPSIAMKAKLNVAIPVFRPYLKGNIDFTKLDVSKISKIIPDFLKYKNKYNDYLTTSFNAVPPKDDVEKQSRDNQMETSSYDLNFLGANSYDIDLSVNMKGISSESNYLKSISFDLNLLNGVIKLNKLVADIFNGSIQSNISISIVTLVPYFNVSFTAMNINPNMLFKFASGVDKSLDGYLNASGAVSTKGATLSSMYNSLNGQVASVSKRFTWNGFDFGNVIEAVQSSSDISEKMKAVKYYMNNGSSIFNTVKWSVKITDGVAESNDITFESSRVNGAMAAKCIIASKMCGVASRFAFTPVGGSGPLIISMQSTGNINSMQTSVDYESIQKYLVSIDRGIDSKAVNDNSIESILRARRGG